MYTCARASLPFESNRIITSDAIQVATIPIVSIIPFGAYSRSLTPLNPYYMCPEHSSLQFDLLRFANNSEVSSLASDSFITYGTCPE